MVGGLGARVKGHLFRRTILAFCLSASALCAAAGVAPAPALRLSATGTLRPGQEVAVGWPPVPMATREFELLLRYEAPLALTVRLTDSKEPSLTAMAWRVPNLPPGRARLLLRVGRRGAEVEWAQSAPFRIAGGAFAPTHRVRLRRGEFWIQEGPAPTPTSLEGGRRTLWSAPGGLPAPADGPSATPALPEPRPSPTLRAASGAPRPVAPHRSLERLPQRRVLRV